MFKKIFFRIAPIIGFDRIYSGYAKNRIFCVGYHSVSERVDPRFVHVSMKADLFEAQIRYMSEQGHTFLHFSDLEKVGEKKVHKPTVIYFDDGFKDVLRIALPILKKYNATATVFVVPEYTETQSDVYMSWDEIRQVKNSGLEIGSHTYHHTPLTDSDLATVRDELVSSKQRIESEIGETIHSFSYPKGRFSADIVGEVKRVGYTHAVTTRYGTNSIDDIVHRPFSLKKVAPRVYESLADFKVRLYSFNFLYDCRD